MALIELAMNTLNPKKMMIGTSNPGHMRRPSSFSI